MHDLFVNALRNVTAVAAQVCPHVTEMHSHTICLHTLTRGNTSSHSFFCKVFAQQCYSRSVYIQIPSFCFETMPRRLIRFNIPDGLACFQLTYAVPDVVLSGTSLMSPEEKRVLSFVSKLYIKHLLRTGLVPGCTHTHAKKKKKQLWYLLG